VTRRRVLAGAAVLLIVSVAVAAYLLTGTPRPQAAPADLDPVRTVAVVKTDLAVSQDFSGTLGFGAETPVKSRTPGTVTWLPASGTKMDRGATLFKVDDRPAVLFFGDTPTYRKLDAPGVKGADVKVVNQNLVALGFLSGAAGRSDTFTEASKAAVKKWQKSLQLEPNGVVEAADVVVFPAAVRVGAVTAQLGSVAEGGVVNVTPDAKVVTLTLDPADSAGVANGAKVDIALPSGKKVGGAVSSVAKAAGKDTGQNNQTSAKLVVTITVDDPAVVDAEEGSVAVKLAATGKQGVLAVPLGALLALQEGGYGLQVVSDGKTTVVPVETGMFAGGLVEVSGPEIGEGTKVVTAS
jgi:peptidoglycan hydrolase-like protein with peptidoglycan-binding domain